MWEFWRRHKKKVYVALGVCGSGYLLYQLYDAQKRKLSDLEKNFNDEKARDELTKATIQAHFEIVQRIADSTTLPHAMHLLDIRLAENLDLTRLTERLILGKGQPNTLTTIEKLDLWDKLKILSFTKMVCSLWSVTMLSLYIKVQANILGRHLYIDEARSIGISDLDETKLIDRNDQQQFLECADHLSNYGLRALISDTEAAVLEVLKGKQLKDFFNVSVLHDTLIHILETLMSSMSSPHHWVGYLMPEDAGNSKLIAPFTSSASDLSHATKFELLMAETHAVILSAEFGNVVDKSLRTVVSELMEDTNIHQGGNNLLSGMPLAKLIPRIAQMGQHLLQESNRNRYIQIINSVSEVEVFFTLLYSSVPSL